MNVIWLTDVFAVFQNGSEVTWFTIAWCHKLPIPLSTCQEKIQTIGSITSHMTYNSLWMHTMHVVMRIHAVWWMPFCNWRITGCEGMYTCVSECECECVWIVWLGMCLCVKQPSYRKNSNISHTLIEQYNCWLPRCSWRITCWRCSNYIFNLD